MKAFLVIIFGLMIGLPALAAQSAPPCWPKEARGTGSTLKQGRLADGSRWVAWTCPMAGVRKLYGVVATGTYAIKRPPGVDGMTVLQMAQAYWTANVDLPLSDPSLKPGLLAMRAAFPTAK
jgi:hypothetical protein